MNQEKLQAEIRDDFEKLSNKYDKKGTGVYAFFVCYMAEQMLISMVKNLPADQSIVFFINILQGMLRDINETYIQKRK
jgi:hypothetical protein